MDRHFFYQKEIKFHQKIQKLIAKSPKDPLSKVHL